MFLYTNKQTAWMQASPRRYTWTPLEISSRAFMGYLWFLQHTHLFAFQFFIWANLFYIFWFGFKFNLVTIQLFLEFSPRTLVVHHLHWAHCSSRDGGGSWRSFCDAPVPDPSMSKYVTVHRILPMVRSVCGESWKIKTLLLCKFISSSHFDNQDTMIFQWTCDTKIQTCDPTLNIWISHIYTFPILDLIFLQNCFYNF